MPRAARVKPATMSVDALRRVTTPIPAAKLRSKIRRAVTRILNCFFIATALENACIEAVTPQKTQDSARIAILLEDS